MKNLRLFAVTFRDGSTFTAEAYSVQRAAFAAAKDNARRAVDVEVPR
jgi:hypothetical protein